MAETRILGKNCVFKLSETEAGDVVDISGEGNEVTLNLELNNEDGTGFGVDWREMVLVDGTWSVDYTAFYATAAAKLTATILGGVTMATLFEKRKFELYPNGSPVGATKPKYSGLADAAVLYLASFPVSIPRSGIVTVRARFNGAGQLARAVA